MSQELNAYIQDWSQNPYFDEETRKEIKALVDSKNESELTERFYRDLEFGTGGLRSIIGAGRNRMNKYQVRKATQALCNQLSKMNLPITVCVGYDSRQFSKEFACEVASVVAGNNGKAFIYDRLLPVPMLSYSIRYHKAQAGVMITASHNPKEYNGYKLFWNDGGQVVPPVDKEVIGEYNAITDWNKIKYTHFDEAIKSGKIQWVGKVAEEAYHNMLYSFSVNPELCLKRGDELKLVYTSIHGTGINAVPFQLNKMGFHKIDIVKKQEKPDSLFSTVKFPNPEYVEALSLAIEQMKKSNADLCYGTDPDCDRLGVVVNHKGQAIALNGNQVAVLLLHYILKSKKEQNKLPPKPLVIKTIVTSELQTTIAQAFGAHIESTLTGFKWMGLRLNELQAEDPSYSFIFSSEESYGYLGHDQCRDKDGVSAAALTTEMALYYKVKGMTLIDALDAIYTEFGFAYEGLLSIDYFGKAGAEKINRIMDHMRNYRGTIEGEEIVEIEDYLNLHTKNLVTNATTPIKQVKSNVIGFKFKSGNKLYLRPSGTEPKIKFYTMVQDKVGGLDQRKINATKKVESIENWIKKEVEPV
jgi:phosphoglucomutase